MNNTISSSLPLVEVKNLCKRFPIASGIFRIGGLVEAVKNVSFSIQTGQIIALVGESGSGKTTIGKMIQGLIQPSSGEIFFNGRNANSISRKERSHLVQTIFQDPYASLNPKLSVGTILRESLQRVERSREESEGEKLSRGNLEEEIAKLLESVGLPKNILNNYPHQFSGGQRQRLVIARVLALNPKAVIADEPVSALDLSIQAQILNLLVDLKEKFKLAYLLITHDLSIVQHLADYLVVLQNGQIAEEGTVEDIFNHPKQEYTQRLLNSLLSIESVY